MRLTNTNIYLDSNATLPLKPQAKKAMIELMDETGNPSAIHGFGRFLRSQIESAREKIASHLNVQSPQVIFTSSGSEANNFVMNSFETSKIVTSAVEHLSILNSAPEAQRIPVSQQGIVDTNWLEKNLNESKADLVSVMLANNETGVMQPIAEIIALAKAKGAHVHSDGVQALGKFKLNFTELGVDYLTLSAHKIGGPQGVGALIVSETAPLNILLRGGGQERRRRAGTENAIGIVGFGAAVDACFEDDWERVRLLRDRIEKEISQIEPLALVIDSSTSRLPNTSCLRMPGVESQKQLMNFDLKGIAVSAGSACSSGKVDHSHVMEALGIRSNDTIRVSLGPHNTEKDVETFIQAWVDIHNQYRKTK